MTTIANPGADQPHASAGGPEIAESDARLAQRDADHAQDNTFDHDPEAKALLRRYLSEVHSYRQQGNYALRNLEARLATLPPSPTPSFPQQTYSAQGGGRPGASSQLIKPSLTGEQSMGKDPGLAQRLHELSAYLHADLGKAAAEPGRTTPPPQQQHKPAPPARQQRARAPHRIPTLPVLDRAWFEERFSVLRASIDRLVEEVPLNRLETLETQFHELMERLTVREEARDPRPLEASLTKLAAYLADSKQWALANEKRVMGLEHKLDRLSHLVAQSHAAISATAKGLELVAKGTGTPLAQKTADIVIAQIGDKIEGLNPADRLDKLGREVAHLSAQSRHLARSAEDRLEQIQLALNDKSKPIAVRPIAPANAAVRPGPAKSAPPAKPESSESSPRDVLESYLNQPIDLEDDYDSDMIAAAQHAARLADGHARNAPSQTGPVRYQIPYGEFLPDENSSPSRAGLIVAVVILLLAGATMLFLKVKEWTLVEPMPAVSIDTPHLPASAVASRQARLVLSDVSQEPSPRENREAALSQAGAIGVAVVTGSTPAAPPLGAKPLELWVASNTPDQAAPIEARPQTAQRGMQEASFREAAVKGNLEAQFSVGQSYLSGGDGENNLAGGERLSKAARWFRRAAEGGHAPSQYRIATLYELGQGTPRNLAEAEAWYERAASQGHIKAMHNLAVLAASQSGKAANYLTAARWFKEAAAYGLVDSQFNLGILYERGLGLSLDLTEAYRWFSLAARQKDDKARQKRDEVGLLLSPSERQTAERLVNEWTPKPKVEDVNRLAPEPPAGQSKDKPAMPRTVQMPSAAVQRASGKADLSQLDRPSATLAIIAEAQRMLKQLGYDPGPIDGIAGRRTQDAIRGFQRRAGLPATGEASQELIVKMAFMPL